LFEIQLTILKIQVPQIKGATCFFGTYSFGVPLKRIILQGGVNSLNQVNDKSIDVKGIKIIAAGKALLPMKRCFLIQ
jgi:hypothetical protein